MGALLSRIFGGILSMFGMGRLTPVANENITYPAEPLTDINEDEVINAPQDTGQENVDSENKEDVAETYQKQATPKASVTNANVSSQLSHHSLTEDEDEMGSEDIEEQITQQATPKESSTHANASCRPSHHSLVGDVDENETAAGSEETEEQIISQPRKESVVPESLSEESQDNENDLKGKQYWRTIQWTGMASSVFISGDWLNWSDMIPLHPDSDFTNWSANVEFPNHLRTVELKFIIDNNWVTSPDMPVITNDVGTQNNVIYL